jgi:pyruvate,orthophosphate dikinase
LPAYVEKSIYAADPFVAIDRNGVGALMRMAVAKGRSVDRDLKVGICGEHGGEPSSVEFCHTIDLNYVSCSPYRVPVARLAAARAVVAEKRAFAAKALAASKPKKAPSAGAKKASPASKTAEEPKPAKPVARRTSPKAKTPAAKKTLVKKVAAKKSSKTPAPKKMKRRR